MKKNRKVNVGLVAIVCLMIATGVVALFIYAVFSQRETHTEVVWADQKMTVLECVAKEPKNQFFAERDKVVSETHKIKITFEDKKAGKIAYDYVGVFENDEEAEMARGTMQARYNIYMGEYEKNLTSTFGSSNLEMRMTIYANAGQMNNLVAPIFFLTEQEGVGFYGYSDELLTTILEAQGFQCEMKE